MNLLEGLERFSRVAHEPSPRVEKDARGWERWHDSGMKERRGRDFAMILAARPKVLIADEPTTGLDATIQSRVLDLMEEINAELRTTTLVITHDMGIANLHPPKESSPSSATREISGPS